MHEGLKLVVKKSRSTYNRPMENGKAIVFPSYCWILMDQIRFYFSLHPGKLTWNLKMNPWKRRFLLETIIFRFQPLVFGGVKPIFFFGPSLGGIGFFLEKMATFRYCKSSFPPIPENLSETSKQGWFAIITWNNPNKTGETRNQHQGTRTLPVKL